jgi:hypothetical protein
MSRTRRPPVVGITIPGQFRDAFKTLSSLSEDEAGALRDGLAEARSFQTVAELQAVACSVLPDHEEAAEVLVPALLSLSGMTRGTDTGSLARRVQ